MTAKGSTHAREIAALATGYLVGLLAYPLLSGAFLAERPSMRLMVAFMLPTTALVIYSLFRSLWTHDTVRTGNGANSAFRATYESIVFRVLLFVVALHAIVMLELTDVMDAAGIRTSAGRLVVVMLGLTFIAIGNLMPRTRPNIAFGIRTTRTLADAQFWQHVHRVGGYATVGLGAITLVTGLTAAHNRAGGLLLAAACVAAMVVFAYYRKHARA